MTPVPAVQVYDAKADAPDLYLVRCRASEKYEDAKGLEYAFHDRPFALSIASRASFTPGI